MTDRSLNITLSEGGQEEVRLTITGSACEVEDLQMEIVRFVKDWKAERQARKPKEPCGCGEVKDAQ